ncbi:MAG: Zn(2+)-responsive transcriptional regulator [Pseudomonadales bacterium]|nr:Zn(2+)-responsive transcriptional regulator [Pseudomonadales bacterium]
MRDNNMAYLKIGELGGLTNTNIETLRFYETKGLVVAPQRSDAGYRLYTEQEVDRVRFIKRARLMGFSLREIEELLSMEKSTCGEVKELAQQRLLDIEERMGELTRMKAALQQITDACVGGDEPATHCTILHALQDKPTARAASQGSVD